MSGGMDLGTLRGYIEFDASGVDAGLNQASESTKSWSVKSLAEMAGIGLALGAVYSQTIGAAMDMEAANSKLKAQLGLNEKDAAKYGESAGRLYAANYGDSLEDVNDALAAVTRNVGGMSDMSQADLEDISAKVLDLASAFDLDLAASARTVGTLMKTGMAKDADEALDIITKGMQSGVNAADDLLDTFDEYSTVFRTMGLEGDDALGILQQGLQGGARDADQIADSLKELLLRVQAGDAKNGLQAIGLDAQIMARDISMGGETAKTATDQIIDAFTGIVDPADKAQIGVALFGTKAEDAQMALNGLDLSSAAADFEALNGPIAGSADAMDAALGEGRASQIEAFKRSMEGAGAAAGNVLLPALDGALFIVNGLGEGVGEVVEFFTDLPEPLQWTAAAVGLTTVAFTGLGTAMKAAVMSNPIGAAIVGVTTALGYLFSATTSAEEAAQIHKDKVDELTGSLETNTGAITDNTEAVVKNQLGEDGIRNLRELGINTNIYTDAVLGNTSSQKALQEQIERGLGKAVAAGEGYAGMAGKLDQAGVSAAELGAAFNANDYTSVNDDLRELGYTIYDTGDGLVTMQNNADGSSVVLSDLGGAASGVRDINRGLAGSIDDVNTAQEQAIQAQSEATDAAYIAAGGAEYMTGKNRDNITALKGVGDAARGVVPDMEIFANGIQEAQEPADALADALESGSSAASEMDTAVQTLQLALITLAGGTVDAEQATRAHEAVIRSVAASARDYAQAQADEADALAKVTKLANEGKEGTEEYEEAQRKAADASAAVADAADGQADALDDLALSAQEMTARSFESTEASQGYDAAVAAATETMVEQRKQFIQSALDAGVPKEAVEALADAQGLIPANVKTSYDAIRADEAKKAAEGVTTAVNNVPETKTVTFAGKVAASLTNSINTALGGIANFAGGYTGGRVGSLLSMPGYAEGGLLGGVSPVDPTMDNLLASVDGQPIKVRSGEFIQSEPAVDHYGVRAMQMVNARQIPKAVLQGYASGGQPAPGSGQSSTTVLRPVLNARIFVGDREIVDIVRVEIEEDNAAQGRMIVGSY